jgi:hypothetical protein
LKFVETRLRGAFLIEIEIDHRPRAGTIRPSVSIGVPGSAHFQNEIALIPSSPPH